MQPFLVDVRFNPKGFSVEISQNVSLVLLNGQRIELADQ